MNELELYDHFATAQREAFMAYLDSALDGKPTARRFRDFKESAEATVIYAKTLEVPEMIAPPKGRK